ncbi:MAG: flagellar biosynthetic protein FliR [Methylococcaceae bacterium]|nr:MAG: flagellar biosynthetic protein FliR [Methylococcaceae bacterium]
MHYTEAQMLEWVARFLWPLLRVGSVFVSLPVFSSHGVPIRVRLIVAVITALVLAPVLPQPPAIELFSPEGFFTVAQEVFIGLLAGYVLQLVYATLAFSGQIIALSMGLGFASLLDPQTGVQVPVVAQIYLIFTTFTFLGADGHLLLIHMLADSFHSLPIGGGIGLPAIQALIAWTGLVFSTGLLIALPIVIVLLIVTLGLGVATRSAPQLNIFSVGFPISLGIGLFLMWLTVPDAVHSIGHLLQESYRVLHDMLLS